jgi:hypothetical protein
MSNSSTPPHPAGRKTVFGCVALHAKLTIYIGLRTMFKAFFKGTLYIGKS